MSEELSRISAELRAAKEEAEKSEKEKADAEERAKKVNIRFLVYPRRAGQLTRIAG
jgi:hypothetical protein